MASMNKFPTRPVAASTGGGGGSPPIAIINGHSSGGASGYISYQAQGFGALKAVLSGSTTANVLKTALNVTGASGRIFFCGVSSENAAARTLRLKLTIDGVVVFDATSNSVSEAGRAVIAVGAANSIYASNGYLSLGDFPFSQSFKIEIASSLTETDGMSAVYSYCLN